MSQLPLVSHKDMCMTFKRTLLMFSITTALALAPPHAAAAVEVWLTSGDQSQLLSPQAGLAFQPGSGTNSTKINIDASNTYQTMEGFGAAMTDSSAWLIQNDLTQPQRDNLMNQLFSPASGIGISYLRVPMGASDFSLSAYTYNDLPSGQTDPNLNAFSIAHDQAYIIPTLQQAKAINPQLQMMATPWTAPAWMKTNGSLAGGSLKSQYYASYANYFVKFFQAYGAQGLDFDILSVQNEPLNTFTNPSMSMTTFEQSTFIGDYLGPALASAGINTGIVAFDHNWDNWNYPLVVMNDPEAGPFTVGAAFHGYAGTVDQQSNLQNFFPGKDIYFTEISGGDWSPNFSDNLVWNIRNIIIGSTRNWSKTALWWNIALDDNGGPNLPGGCVGCRGVVTIDSSTGNVQLNEEYYSIAHASKFVKPGAVRIDSDTFDNLIETVAFLNPDGSKVLIAVNPSSSARWFDVLENGEAFSYRITAESVATFVWPGPSPLAGDLNGDGFVGIADLNIVLGAWNQNVPPGDPLADPTGDGFVGIADLNIVLGNWNAGTPPTAATAPEPGTIGLFALAGAMIGGRRKTAPKA
jgi:glucosylceramidase